MKPLRPFEAWRTANINPMTQLQIPGVLNLQQSHCKNLKHVKVHILTYWPHWYWYLRPSDDTCHHLHWYLSHGDDISHNLHWHFSPCDDMCRHLHWSQSRWWYMLSYVYINISVPCDISIIIYIYISVQVLICHHLCWHLFWWCNHLYWHFHPGYGMSFLLVFQSSVTYLSSFILLSQSQLWLVMVYIDISFPLIS